MFFATPILRQATYASRADDAALQRFLREATTPARQHEHFSATQTEEATTLTLDVPGLAREQLQLQLEDNMVYLRSVEGAPRTVQRSWKLNHAIDATASHAKLEHGVLTLTLARQKPVDKKVALDIQ